MKITMLGTSGSSPTKVRAMPSVALSYNGDILLLDCGEGTQMQMLRYGINSSRIKAIFISHAHGDHVIGLAGLVRTMAMNRRQTQLDIFVPAGSEKIINTLISFDRALITYKIAVHGARPGTLYKGRGFSVTAFALNHSVPSCGYAFKEDDRVRFIEDKCKKLGVRGEMHSVIQRLGRLRIGKKVIKLGQVTSKQPGKKVVYASDTRPTMSAAKAAKDADVLIHESSYSLSEAKLAKERKHSTSAEAAAVAKKAGAKLLVLTHISARYNNADAMENEAMAVFKNSKVAKDGDVIIV
ncbi:MAG: ribonuclease Z [Candidatus Micrarchaeaceae archaeon]